MSDIGTTVQHSSRSKLASLQIHTPADRKGACKGAIGWFWEKKEERRHRFHYMCASYKCSHVNINAKMASHRPSTILKGGIQSFHTLRYNIPAPPDYTEAPSFQQSNTNTKLFFCARTRLQRCRHLIVTVSMELSVVRTSIKFQPMQIKARNIPLSLA